MNVVLDLLNVLLQGGQGFVVFGISVVAVSRHFLDQLLHLFVALLLFVNVALEEQTRSDS